MTTWKPGDHFDPLEAQKQKLYPVDVIDARTDIGDGPKRLYSKLFRLAAFGDRGRMPWQGFICASEEYLAKLLGKSAISVRRDSADLRALGLVRVGRPIRRGNNCYSFVWLTEFDRSDVIGRRMDADRSDVISRNSADRSNMSGQNPPDRSNVIGPDRSDVIGLYSKRGFITDTPGTDATEIPVLANSTSPNPAPFLKVEPSANGATASAGRGPQANNTAPRRPVAVIVAPAPLEWPLGGWAGPEEFETWWDGVVRNHPNKSRNAVAKTKAIELLMAGILQLAEFEAGYSALRRTSEERWSEDHGRYAPNLHTVLEDRLWQHAAVPVVPRPVMKSASEYLQRIQAE